MRTLVIILIFSLLLVAPTLASHAWDNSSLIYRQHINITNNDAQQLYNRFTINTTINHNAIINRSSIGGNDVRIYCGTTQKHRINETAWNLTNTRIRFRMDEFNITANGYNDTGCSVYYGNNSALDTAPQNYTSIYLAYSDFSTQSDLDNFRTTTDGTTMTLLSGTLALNTSSTPIHVNYTSFINFSYPTPFLAVINVSQVTGAQDIINGLSWHNATSFSGGVLEPTDNFTQVTCWQVNSRFRTIDTINGSSSNVNFDVGCSDYAISATNTVGIIYNLTNISFFNATGIPRNISSRGWRANSQIGLTAFGGDNYRFDNFTVRIYAASEPSVSFGSEQNITLNLVINSPRNITYNITIPALNFTTVNGATPNACWYSLNGGQNTTLTNCQNLSRIGDYGQNNLTIFANTSGNIISNASVSFIAVQLNLTRCSGTGTPIFNFTYRTEENDAIQNAFGNNGNNFETTLITYPANQTTVQTNFTFNLTNSSYYDLCANVNAGFRTDTTIRYYNTSFSTRFYYFENFETNQSVLNNFTLYLLESSLSSPIIYNVRESDGVTGASNVLVYADRFYSSINQFRTVSVAKTDSTGKGFTFLKMNTVEHQFRLLRGSDLKNTITKSVLGGDASVGLTLTLSLGVTVLSSIFQFFNQVTGSCTANTTTSIVRCTYTDSSSTLQRMYLTVQRNGSLTWSQVCQVTSTDLSGTLTCNVAPQGNGTYYYWLQGKFTANNTQYKVADGGFKVGGTLAPFGSTGLLAAFFLILMMAMLSVYNPIGAIILGVTGLAISVAIGFVEITGSSLIGIVIVAFIIILKSRST